MPAASAAGSGQSGSSLPITTSTGRPTCDSLAAGVLGSGQAHLAQRSHASGLGEIADQ